MEFLIALALIAVVGAFVARPLLARATDDGAEIERRDRFDDLEARKLTLYREIKDAAEDRATGKLSEEDFQRIDGELRAEAIAVLKQLDDLVI